MTAATIAPTTAPTSAPGLIPAAGAVAGRTVKKFLRTPQLVFVGAIQGAMFLLIFRYVFGGAIDAGGVSYVDFLVPGFIVTGVLFSGTGAAVRRGGRRGQRLPRPSALASHPAVRRAGGQGLRRRRAGGVGAAHHDRHRLRRGLPHPRRRAGRPGRPRPVRRLRPGLRVAVHLHRPGRRQRGSGPGDVPAGLPPGLRVECLRAGRHHAIVAAALRRAPAAHRT